MSISELLGGSPTGSQGAEAWSFQLIFMAGIQCSSGLQMCTYLASRHLLDILWHLLLSWNVPQTQSWGSLKSLKCVHHF